MVNIHISDIFKEVGQGFGPESMKELLKLPILAIDFAANGGTNFSKLELLRNEPLKAHYEDVIALGHSASEMVDFLKSIMPSKSLGELYNSIGFEKHGKTVLYRELLRHLDASADKFIIAPGVKGMVMTVFTLPSYSMVFKMINDKFRPPKMVTEQEVKSKYDLVSAHDRVGRMADSHMFENLTLPLNRFDSALIEELKKFKLVVNSSHFVTGFLEVNSNP